MFYILNEYDMPTRMTTGLMTYLAGAKRVRTAAKFRVPLIERSSSADILTFIPVRNSPLALESELLPGTDLGVGRLRRCSLNKANPLINGYSVLEPSTMPRVRLVSLLPMYYNLTQLRNVVLNLSAYASRRVRDAQKIAVLFTNTGSSLQM